jgi:transposase-like protein
MYFGSLGFHFIARLIGVSQASIMNWIKKYGRQLKRICNPGR